MTSTGEVMEAMTSEREAFEKWARESRLYPMSREESDTRFYHDPLTQSAWEGWRAKAHLAQPAQNKDYCPCMREDCPKCYAQPAQAVDVGAIEPVIRELRKWPKEETFYDHRATRLECADKLTRALSGSGNDVQVERASIRDHEWQTIRQALRDQEAEIATLTKMLADCFRMSGADPDGDDDRRLADYALRAVTDLRRDYDDVLDWQTRCEKAEALLRDASRYLDPRHYSEMISRITAHLGAEQ